MPEIIDPHQKNIDSDFNKTLVSSMVVPKRDEISTKDIAAALVLLKRKHRLSINCINDVIHLLKNLHVPNTPSSWYKVKRLLTSSEASSKVYSICSACHESKAEKGNCPNCAADHSRNEQKFHIFSIREQLQQVLINNPNIDLLHQHRSSTMSDVCDGAVVQSISAINSNAFVTLTMNIDGVQFSKGSQSTIWPILLVINELPAKIRFDVENLILAGVWPGPSKPSRDQIRLLYNPLMDELRYLENGHVFEYDDQNVIIPVYLIAACCDKPAQAIVQCIAEPIGQFGCGRCEIEGDVIFLITNCNDPCTFE